MCTMDTFSKLTNHPFLVECDFASGGQNHSDHICTPHLSAWNIFTSGIQAPAFHGNLALGLHSGRHVLLFVGADVDSSDSHEGILQLGVDEILQACLAQAFVEERIMTRKDFRVLVDFEF